MAIQQAINQGITTAAVMGKLSGIPEMRRAGKYQKAILEGAHGMTPEGEAKFDQREFEQIRPAVKAYTENQMELFKKTGKSKYLKEFQETVESAKQFDPTPRRDIIRMKLKQIQKENVKARKELLMKIDEAINEQFTANIGGKQINDPELLNKLKEASNSGK